MTTGWDYKAIRDEAKALDEELKQQPRVACPKCGAILQVNSRGIYNCPMGHYRDTWRAEGDPLTQP